MNDPMLVLLSLSLLAFHDALDLALDDQLPYFDRQAHG